MFSQTIQARLRAPLSTDQQLAAIFAPRRAADSGLPGPGSAASLATSFLGGGARHFNTVARYEASLERAQRHAFRYLDSRPAPLSAGEPAEDGPGQPGEPVPAAHGLTASGAETWKSALAQCHQADRLSAEPASCAESAAARLDTGACQTKPNRPHPDQPNPSQLNPTQPRPAEPDRTQRNQTQSGQTQSGPTQSSPTRSSPTHPSQTQSGPTQSSQNQSSQTQPRQNQPNQAQSGPTKPNEPNPSRYAPAPEPKVSERTQSPDSDRLPGAPGGALAA
jgi:hypothetical protein